MQSCWGKGVFPSKTGEHGSHDAHLSEHPWALRAESLRRSQGQQPEDWSGSAGGGDDTQLEDEYSLIYLIVCCDIRNYFCPHICWLIPHFWCETAGLRHLLCGLHLEEVPARVAETLQSILPCLKPSDGHERDIPSLGEIYSGTPDFPLFDLEV